MAAPRPRPAGIKLLEGQGKGRDSGGRPVVKPPGFTRLPPDAPDFLPDEARAEWERVVPELQRLHLTKQPDRAALTAYCLTWARLVSAHQEWIAGGGSVLSTNSQGTVRNPVLAAIESASKELRSWCIEFGLTPSAEARVSRPEGSDDGEWNPFAEKGTG